MNNSGTPHPFAISVVGPQGAGKTTLLKCIRNNSICDEAKLNSDNAPSFSYSIIDELSQLSLYKPMRYGLLVQSLQHIYEMQKASTKSYYDNFMTFLYQLAWFGIDNFTMLITKMDWAGDKSEDLFNMYSNSLKEFYERKLKLNVNCCIPLSLNTDNSLDNLFCLNPNGDLAWYKGPSVIDAMMSLAKKYPVSINGLWLIASLKRSGFPKQLRVIPNNLARGYFAQPKDVVVYPGSVKGSINSNKNILSLKAEDFISLEAFGNISSGPYVILDDDTNARHLSDMDLHVRLNKDVSPDDLKTGTGYYGFSFFGPQKAQGEIERCTVLDDPAIGFHGDEIPLGKEVLLKVYCVKAVVISLYVNDHDAGKIIIWDYQIKDQPFPIGVGRIINFPDIKIQDCTEKLMILDRLRTADDPNKNLLIFDLESIYHEMKRFMELAQLSVDANEVEDRKRIIHNHYSQLIDKICQYKDTSGYGSEKGDLFSIIPHLRIMRDQAIQRYSMLSILISEKTKSDLSIRRISQFEKDYSNSLEFIRKCTIKPIRTEAIKAITNQKLTIKQKITLHNSIPGDISYYPVRPAVIECIYDAIAQLIDNSIKNCADSNKLKLDIFIDAPVNLIDRNLQIQFIENSTLTDNLFHDIQRKKRGLFVLEEKLKKIGVYFRKPDKIGLGISATIKIPVWRHRTNKLLDILYEIIDILNTKDINNFSDHIFSEDNLNTLSSFFKINFQIEDVIQLLNNALSNISDRFTKQIQNDLDYLSVQYDEATHSEIINHLEILRTDPIKIAIYNPINKINTSYDFEYIKIIDCRKVIPPYRCDSVRKLHLLGDAIYWGFEDFINSNINKNRYDPFSIVINNENNSRDNFIICEIESPSNLKRYNSLISFITRLDHLGVNVKTLSQYKLQLIFPVIFI